MRTLIADYIATVRKRLHVSQTELARAIGVSRVLVARWESGDRPVPERCMAPLARALQLADDGELRTLQELTVEASCRAIGVTNGIPSPLAAPYDNSRASVEAMVALGYVAQSAQAWAADNLGSAPYLHFSRVFPRDTVHELLGAHHLLARGGRMVLLSPLHLDCHLMVVQADGPYSYTGHHARPALLWQQGNEVLVVFSQVTIAVTAQSRRYRADQLVWYRGGSGRSHWVCVEFDGAFHAETANQDARRAVGIGALEVRFENGATMRSDFFEMRYLHEIRRKTQWVEQKGL